MHRFLLTIFTLLFITTASGQDLFPKAILDSISAKAQEHMLFGSKLLEQNHQQGLHPSGASAAFIALEKVKDWRIDAINPSHNKSTDTLFVGLIPGDSLYITGAFMNDGPILVYGDGILIIENARLLLMAILSCGAQQAALKLSIQQ